MQVKHFHVLMIALIFSIRSYGQQAGINEDGPGILIPMSTASRLGIPAIIPADMYFISENTGRVYTKIIKQ